MEYIPTRNDDDGDVLPSEDSSLEEDESLQEETPKSAAGENLFPRKLHNLISDAEQEGNEDIVSWTPDGMSFKVHKREEFELELLPRYFVTTKFRSYQKNLSLWKFSTVSLSIACPRRGESSHPLFRRGCPELCTQMKRVTVISKKPKEKMRRHKKKKNNKRKAIVTQAETTPDPQDNAGLVAAPVVAAARCGGGINFPPLSNVDLNVQAQAYQRLLDIVSAPSRIAPPVTPPPRAPPVSVDMSQCAGVEDNLIRLLNSAPTSTNYTVSTTTVAPANPSGRPALLNHLLGSLSGTDLATLLVANDNVNDRSPGVYPIDSLAEVTRSLESLLSQYQPSRGGDLNTSDLLSLLGCNQVLSAAMATLRQPSSPPPPPPRSTPILDALRQSLGRGGQY